MSEEAVSSDIRVRITPRQAAWLCDLAASGSETYARALDEGARVEASGYLVIPPAAAYQLGLAVGIRADIADEGEYSISMRNTVLGLSRKLAAAGITSAAPFP